MKEMIETLLDFTRLRFGAFPLSFRPADLGEIARGVVDEMRAGKARSADRAACTRRAPRPVGSRSGVAGHREPREQRACLRRARDDGQGGRRRERARGDRHGEQPRRLDPSGLHGGDLRALPPRRAPATVRPTASGSACTSSSRSCSPTEARSTSSRTPRTARRSRCACRWRAPARRRSRAGTGIGHGRHRLGEAPGRLILHGRPVRTPRASWGGRCPDRLARLVEDPARPARDVAEQPQDDDRRHAGQPLPDDAGLGAGSPASSTTTPTSPCWGSSTPPPSALRCASSGRRSGMSSAR